jgi:hypothetical protein
MCRKPGSLILTKSLDLNSARSLNPDGRYRITALKADLDSSVDGLLGHDTVGGPLAPGNGDQVALRHVHHVVPHCNTVILISDNLQLNNKRGRWSTCPRQW